MFVPTSILTKFILNLMKFKCFASMYIPTTNLELSVTYEKHDQVKRLPWF